MDAIETIRANVSPVVLSAIDDSDYDDDDNEKEEEGEHLFQHLSVETEFSTLIQLYMTTGIHILNILFLFTYSL